MIKYLPFDDIECLENVCRDHSFELDETTRREALERKSRNYQRLLRGGFPMSPGAAQLVQTAAGHYPLAIASGARRVEIESALDSIGLKHYFTVIVAAEDFVLGKPNPESFLLALERLNAARDSAPILPGECLVIEDSVGGVRGARAAGMRCMAVTSSYPREALQAANKIVATLENVPLDSLKDLFEEIR